MSLRQAQWGWHHRQAPQPSREVNQETARCKTQGKGAEYKRQTKEVPDSAHRVPREQTAQVSVKGRASQEGLLADEILGRKEGRGKTTWSFDPMGNSNKLLQNVFEIFGKS